MSVTELDLAKAREIAPRHESWCSAMHDSCCGNGDADCDCGTQEIRERVAAALAEERAPFLARERVCEIEHPTTLRLMQCRAAPALL